MYNEREINFQRPHKWAFQVKIKQSRLFSGKLSVLQTKVTIIEL